MSHVPDEPVEMPENTNFILDEFLYLLRPYRGSLPIMQMHEIENLLSEMDRFVLRGGVLSFSVISSTFHFFHCVQYWTLKPDGMFLRNGLIDAKEEEILSAWLLRMESTFCRVLGRLEQIEITEWKQTSEKGSL